MVTGSTVIDCSVGPIFHHLLAMCDFVQKITILKLNDGSLKELEKWKNKDPDALDWAHVTEFIQEIKGKSDKLDGEEENLRGKIDQILKWDPSRGDPADLLLLPKADIAINYVILELISKDHDDYRRNLRKICNIIKPGGYLILYAAINCSYFKIGEDKYHFLSCDERFYRNVISGEGFEIEHIEKIDRVMCTDAVDHEKGIFIIGHKVKELLNRKSS
ncbi:hypothetical protein GDO78_022590 [Eleutherodactylus coqui]|uniref:Nicotinamide N-methyltransferase n=1 Tax=Eleutherodactylus coqui TaxID=57060 RepID=A0A8J6B9D7_ELECQ|nr:hypothetical protein GDO78_022590 [Eleutherodactylus coqui]